MSASTDQLSVDGVSIVFNRVGGTIDDFAIGSGKAEPLRPLHRAPWTREQETLPASVPLVERQLAGDFLCAPFGSPGGATPIHGPAANGHWQADALHEHSNGARTASYVLQEPVCGARVIKSLTLHPGHPLLYQNHRFQGGMGHLPIAHHAMIHVPGGVRLSFSRKQYGVTPGSPLESDPARGHSMLAYPQTFHDVRQVLTSDGDSIDASRYPFASGHEDILILAEATETHLGWSAALAQKDGFLFFAIKEASALPETILWISNGGRYYPPWSRRHTSVLGIEEASTSCHENHSFSSDTLPSSAGLAQGLVLDTSSSHDIRYAFGAIPVPAGWSVVTDIVPDATSIRLQDESGDSVTLPFAGEHFGL